MLFNRKLFVMKKILIIDDDKDLLLVLNRLFEKNNYSSRMAATINEGLELIEDFLPDIVFLDIHIGESDGRELSQVIKSETGESSVPIVLISGDDTQVSPLNLYGAVEFLAKPFSDNDILRITKMYTSDVSSSNVI